MQSPEAGLDCKRDQAARMSPSAHGRKGPRGDPDQDSGQQRPASHQKRNKRRVSVCEYKSACVRRGETDLGQAPVYLGALIYKMGITLPTSQGCYEWKTH